MDKSALAIPAMAKLGLAAVGTATAAWMGTVTAGLTTQAEAIVVLQKATLASQERELKLHEHMLRLVGLIENLSKLDDRQTVSCRPAFRIHIPPPPPHPTHEGCGARLQETLGKAAEALDQGELLLAALEKRTAALEKPASAATLAITTGMASEPSYLKTEQSSIIAQIVSCAAPPPRLMRRLPPPRPCNS